MTGLLLIAIVYLGVGLAVWQGVQTGRFDPVDAVVTSLFWPFVILDLFV